MRKTLPRELTSYDLLKTLAVFLMIVDHSGYHLFPDNEWFRVIGRMCVPIWFFLVGYAKSRDTGRDLWFWMLLLVLGNISYGHYLFPFNILATILVVRYGLDIAARFVLWSYAGLAAFLVAMTALIIPANQIVEYGTLGFILAMIGYLVRHQEERGLSDRYVEIYAFLAFLIFVLEQAIAFHFTQAQFVLLSVGSGAAIYMLLRFQPMTLAWNGPQFIKGALQFTGRHTMQIYVLHIIALGYLAMALGDERFAFFQWHWMPPLNW